MPQPTILNAEPRMVSGWVKWFDQVKGYGFVTDENGGRDVLIHSSCLKQSGQAVAPEGAKIVCEVVESEKGLQAVKILELDSTTILAKPRPVDAPAMDFVKPAGDFEACTVKWFSRAKGYGFLTRGEGTADIFVHMEVVRAGGMTELVPGQRLRVSFGQGPKGLLAAALEPAREN